MARANPIKQRNSALTAAIAVLLTAVALGTFALTSAVAQPANPGGDAVITVVFTEDDMGFNVTSTKGISNVIVQFCDLSMHKHEDEFDGTELKEFNHTETQAILGIWVKSGNNGIEGNDPPGAGERFDNEGVTCDTTTPTPTSTPTPTETTEIPFFPSSMALVLGLVGALGGTFVLMRRRS